MYSLHEGAFVITLYIRDHTSRTSARIHVIVHYFITFLRALRHSLARLLFSSRRRDNYGEYTLNELAQFTTSCAIVQTPQAKQAQSL